MRQVYKKKIKDKKCRFKYIFSTYKYRSFYFNSCKKKIFLFLVPPFFNIMLLVLIVLIFNPKKYFKTYV